MTMKRNHIISISHVAFLCIVATLLANSRPAKAQHTLTLDSCRSLALAGNKELGISQVNRNMAENLRSAARTDYLPKVDAVGTYQLTSREISLLSKSQQNALNNLGTNISDALQGGISSSLPSLVEQGTITAEQARNLSSLASQLSPSMASALNKAGQNLRKDLRTNNRNLFAADVMIRQPLYMGGAIKAANRAADININMADDNIDLTTQNTIYDVDQAYWLVVSLRQKQILADQYLDLVVKLHDDVSKMLEQGVATRADELKVAVRVNEAEMQQTQVEDGLVLARMNLCQICGIALDSDIRLADEDKADFNASYGEYIQGDSDVYDNRPELRLLKNTVELSKQNTIITRAAFLPQVLATGGYFISNPNVLNGYKKDFSGLFHVGVTLRLPLWNWGEGRHKTRASKAATLMAELQLDDMKEKVDLQVRQAEFRMKEAYKKLNMATHNLSSAEENLRCANVGFKEGMMQTTDVMEAQTAWQSAWSQKIDAEIDVRLARVNLYKTMGILNVNN